VLVVLLVLFYIFPGAAGGSNFRFISGGTGVLAPPSFFADPFFFLRRRFFEGFSKWPISNLRSVISSFRSTKLSFKRAIVAFNWPASKSMARVLLLILLVKDSSCMPRLFHDC